MNIDIDKANQYLAFWHAHQDVPFGCEYGNHNSTIELDYMSNRYKFYCPECGWQKALKQYHFNELEKYWLEHHE